MRGEIIKLGEREGEEEEREKEGEDMAIPIVKEKDGKAFTEEDAEGEEQGGENWELKDRVDR